MTNAERLLLVSADSHAAAPPETYRPFLEARYVERLDDLAKENERFVHYTDKLGRFPDDELELIDTDGAIRSGGVDGAFDLDRRLQEMDREGISAELVLPGAQAASTPFFGASNEAYPPDVRAAGARAYHRWLGDMIGRSGGRLIGVANCGPCLDMDETIKELERAASQGFRSVSVPGIVADPEMPPLWDGHFEPFWKSCADQGIVLSVHAGHGHPQGKWIAFLDSIFRADEADDSREMLKALLNTRGGPLDLDYIPAQVMWTLMLVGLFDRYPDLQLALTEVRADWVPGILAVLDERYARGDTPLKKSPTEYWRSNCWAGASSIKQSEVRLRREIGVDRIMFGRDFPHPESTWPNTFDWLREAFVGVPDDEVRAMVGENAIRCYGLDRTALQTVADRIGPPSSTLLSTTAQVDPRIVDHFAERAGYRKSYEVIDPAVVAEMFQKDLEATSAH
jgi:predicted TIM-barrel fold metal-dependent hydrolase